MKKLICSLVITFLMGLSVNAFAQAKKAGIANTAYLSAKTSKKVLDAKTAEVTFQLNNITDASIMDKYKKQFEKFQRIQKVTATMGKNGMASYTVKMDKENTIGNLKNMFIKARIENVNVDGKVVPTVELNKLKPKPAAPAAKK